MTKVVLSLQSSQQSLLTDSFLQRFSAPLFFVPVDEGAVNGAVVAVNGALHGILHLSWLALPRAQSKQRDLLSCPKLCSQLKYTVLVHEAEKRPAKH